MVSRSGRTTAIVFRVPNAVFDRLAEEAEDCGMKPVDLARQMVVDGVGYVPPPEEAEDKAA